MASFSFPRGLRLFDSGYAWSTWSGKNTHGDRIILFNRISQNSLCGQSAVRWINEAVKSRLLWPMKSHCFGSAQAGCVISSEFLLTSNKYRDCCYDSKPKNVRAILMIFIFREKTQADEKALAAAAPKMIWKWASLPGLPIQLWYCDFYHAGFYQRLSSKICCCG